MFDTEIGLDDYESVGIRIYQQIARRGTDCFHVFIWKESKNKLSVSVSTSDSQGDDFVLEIENGVFKVAKTPDDGA